MPRENFDALERAVISNSQSRTWSAATLGWEVIGLDEDPNGAGVCVCGHTDLRWLFNIENRRNGSVLHPIGSVCVNHFEREDLDRDVNVLPRLLAMRAALLEGENVILTAKFFSRALLEYLEDSGAFPLDQWNTVDGHEDYWFLLEMFNKRNKDAHTKGQRWKIRILLRDKVFPFVRSDPRLDSSSTPDRSRSAQ